MSLYRYLFGYRWCILFEYTKTQGYVLMADSVMGLLGNLAPICAEGLRPIPPWSVYLCHSKSGRSIRLYGDEFSPSGRLSQGLLADILSIDSGWNVPIDEPVFEEIGSKRRLPMEPQNAMEIYEAMKRGEDVKQKDNFWSIMDVIFGPPTQS